MHRILFFLGLCIGIIQGVNAQCSETYAFQKKKMKVKVGRKTQVTRQLISIELDTSVTSDNFVQYNTREYDCSSSVPTTFPGQIEDVLTSIVASALDADQVDGEMRVVIKDFRRRSNWLPRWNPMVLLSADIFDESGVLLFSGTVYRYTFSFLEKDLGKLFGDLLDVFFQAGYSSGDIELSRTLGSEDERVIGIYGSHIDLINNSPISAFNYRVEVDTTETVWAKYSLFDSLGNDVSTTVHGVYTGDKILLSTTPYYLKKHLVEIRDLNENFFVGYDRVYDNTTANSTTALSGGGLLGAAIGTIAAENKAVFLINKETGAMHALTRAKLKEVFKKQKAQVDRMIEFQKNDQVEEMFELVRTWLSTDMLKIFE